MLKKAIGVTVFGLMMCMALSLNAEQLDVVSKSQPGVAGGTTGMLSMSTVNVMLNQSAKLAVETSRLQKQTEQDLSSSSYNIARENCRRWSSALKQRMKLLHKLQSSAASFQIRATVGVELKQIKKEYGRALEIIELLTLF